MIISASRRTDIPAYFSDWFVSRIKAGYCTVPNPFNSKQISLVSLKPNEVTAIIFWTRNASPLQKKLHILDELNYKYYFQFTLNNYPKVFEPNNPSFEQAIKSFRDLSNKIGPGKIIWRYDPIIFNKQLTLEFHIKNFIKIFNEIKGYTNRIVISIVDVYKKTKRRLKNIGYDFNLDDDISDIELFIKNIVEIAFSNNMIVQSCAEPNDMSSLGVIPGKCIDDELLRKEFGIDLKYTKDKTQRLACGCMTSKDIGVNNTCLMGCEYCYATSSHELAIQNFKKHDSKFSSLIPHEVSNELKEKIRLFENNLYKPEKEQIDLFGF